MKVLHVISGIDPTTGGTATALTALAPALVRAGMAITIISAFDRPEDEAAKALRRKGVQVIQIGPVTGALSRHPQILPKLQKLVPEADVVHAHGLWEEIQHQAARISRGAGVPYIISAHGMLDPWSLAQSRWKKKLYLALRLRRDLNGAAAIHYTSQAEAEASQSQGFKTRALVHPLGIDFEEFSRLPPRGRFRDRYPQLAAKRVLLYLGRLYPQKGLELLVPALAQCGVADAMLAVAGPDQAGYQAQVHQMARDHGVEQRVVFTGMLRGEQRLEALVDADLLTLPSFHENFGMVVVESLACGVPVIISDQVNIWREIAAAGVGAVVPTQVTPLASAMRTWLTDDSLRRRAAERARPFVERTYDLSRVAQEWAESYRQIIATHRKSS